MSDLKKRIRRIEETVNPHTRFPVYGTVEYLAAWLKLPELQRVSAKIPELTTELLDGLIDKHRPIVINHTPWWTMDEEGNIHYPPDYGRVTGEPLFVGLHSCSSVAEAAGMSIYDVVKLLQPCGGREFLDKYLGVYHTGEVIDYELKKAN